jgi:hypothetical protein
LSLSAGLFNNNNNRHSHYRDSTNTTASIEDDTSSEHAANNFLLNATNSSSSVNIASIGNRSGEERSSIYMNCDLIERVHRFGDSLGGFDTGSQGGGEDAGTPDRSSLNEISDLENQLDAPSYQSQPKLKMRNNILNEIVQTERNYLKSLKLVIDVSTCFSLSFFIFFDQKSNFFP